MAYQKELCIICGPNGAGKTTLIRTFSVDKKEIEIAPNPDEPTSNASSM